MDMARSRSRPLAISQVEKYWPFVPILILPVRMAVISAGSRLSMSVVAALMASAKSDKLVNSELDIGSATAGLMLG